MVEISLEWLAALVIAFFVLAFVFTLMLVYMLYSRLGRKGISSQESDSKQTPGLLGGLEERLLDRRSEAVVMAPPVKGEDGKQWLLLYRQPESQSLTVSLPDHEVVVAKDDLSPAELQTVKDMSVGLQHWLGNETTVVPVFSRPVPIVRAPVEEPKGVGMGLLLSRKREDSDVVPVVSIVVQINAVLQNMLLHEDYQGASIHLDENEAGDLVVWVGTQAYIGLDTVPDAQVTEIVRRAAQRWTDNNLAK